jgi:hypothetical protein
MNHPSHAFLIILFLLIFFPFSVYIRCIILLMFIVGLMITIINSKNVKAGTTVVYIELKTLDIEKDGYILSQDCCICLEAFNNKETKLCLLRCGHIYHQKCIDTWLLQKKSCPVCVKSF